MLLVGVLPDLQNHSSKCWHAAGKAGSTDVSGQQSDPQHPGHKQQLTLSSLRGFYGAKASEILVCSREEGVSEGRWSSPAAPRQMFWMGKSRASPQLIPFPSAFSGKALKEQQLSTAP